MSNSVIVRLATKPTKSGVVSQILYGFCSKKMTIVTLSEGLLLRLSPKNDVYLRDRILSGFCVRIGRRSRTFYVVTSVAGVQVRVKLGRWPLISVEDARQLAVVMLKDCRAGQLPNKSPRPKMPVLTEAVISYCDVKRLKDSSKKRYLSLIRTHFASWQEISVDRLVGVAFTEHCQQFAHCTGAALVEVGRGLIGALFKYLNATHGLNLETPFSRLAAAGLMPDRSKPRERRLQHDGLASWYVASQSLPPKQRDLLMLLALTGLRRNEGGMLRRDQVDIAAGVLHIPDTKTGQAHSLPITPMMSDILIRRCTELADDQLLFGGVSFEHLAEMAMRSGAPRFMLHDLRKLLATTGQQLGLSDAILRRILNHKAKRSDTLHRHYVRLSVADIHDPLVAIQRHLLEQMNPEK